MMDVQIIVDELCSDGTELNKAAKDAVERSGEARIGSDEMAFSICRVNDDLIPTEISPQGTLGGESYPACPEGERVAWFHTHPEETRESARARYPSTLDYEDMKEQGLPVMCVGSATGDDEEDVFCTMYPKGCIPPEEAISIYRRFLGADNSLNRALREIEYMKDEDMIWQHRVEQYVGDNIRRARRTLHEADEEITLALMENTPHASGTLQMEEQHV